MKKIKLSDGREVVVKDFTVRMMRNAMKQEGEVEQTISMVSQISGLTEDEIDALPMFDFMALQEEVKRFLSKPPAEAPKTK